jgi:lipopolysaccharide export system permease protein
MKISTTLSRYLARTYFMNMLLLLGILLAIIYLFDAVELIRRASKKSDIPLTLVLQMVFLKLPKEGQILLPFAILYSAMFTFWQLTRRYELVVVRAAGFSFWQFLAPIMIVAIMAGFLHMGVINPIGALLTAKYEQMERGIIEQKENQIALFKEGLWLRQTTGEGYVILHSRKIHQPGWSLQNPTALFFTNEDQYLRRIDATSAQLEVDRWVFEDVNIQEAQGAVRQNIYILPTTLTRADVEDSFSSPSTMSFWRLRSHIQTLEETGFDPTRLKVYYQSLLAQPLLFAAMVLLAASVAMRPPRAHGTLVLIMAGVFIGFVIFFMSSFLQAMGSTRQIPVPLAAWSPALISFLLGLGVMMNLEDG